MSTESKPTFASDKACRFGESVIREMTRMAERFEAINLAQGFPDFPAPRELKEAAKESIESDHNQYSFTWGTASLREAIARRWHRISGIAADPERDIVVTCGATEAVIASLLALVNPGEDVIVFEPFYENYAPGIALCGAKPRYVRLHEPDFHIDEAELRRAFSYNTKAIILNTPHNPTGKVFTPPELELIARLCMEWDVLAIADEVYEHIVYDGRKHVSLASMPGMSEITITVSSLGKTFAATGWRVGWAVAPGDIMEPIRKVHDFLTVSAPHPFQHAAVAALALPETYFEELQHGYARRRNVLMDSLTAAGFRFHIPQGAYYVMADISGFGYPSDVAFADYLVREVGVACVPGSSFYEHSEHGRNRVRFAFCKRPETLALAGQRLRRLRDV